MAILNQEDFKEFLHQHPKQRILSLDVGTKKIGLAMSDKGRMLATPLNTIERKNFKQCFGFIMELIEAEKVCALVIGLPLHMDGKEGDMSNRVRQFAKEFIKLYDMPILLADERLSSKKAESFLHFAGYSKNKKREIKDNIAAAHILQTVLDELF